MPSPLSSSRMRALASLAVQTIFTPSLCILLAIGSMILGLVWVFLDLFAGMTGIDIDSWLPLVMLLAVMAMLMSENWLAAALALPLVMGALAGLYFLLLLIGSLVWLPAPSSGASGLVLLLLLNGSIFWLTRRVQRAGDQKKQQNVQLHRRALRRLPKTALALALGGLFINAYFWDDSSKRWWLSDLFP